MSPVFATNVAKYLMPTRLRSSILGMSTVVPKRSWLVLFTRLPTPWRHYHHKHSTIGASHSSNSNRTPTIPRQTPAASAGADTESTVCDQCDKEFSSSLSLRRHVHLIHGDGAIAINYLVCPYCGKSYKTKDSLGQHIGQVHEGVDFRCDICNRMCQAAEKLWKEKVGVHGMTDLPLPPNVTLYECEYCHKKLLRGLEAHVKRHHPERLEEYRESARAKFNLELKDQKGNPDTISLSTLRKRQYRALLKEKGPAAAQGLIPKWLLPRQCPVCGEMVSGRSFRLHLRKHKTSIWVPRTFSKSNDKKQVQTKGTFVDAFKVSYCDKIITYIIFHSHFPEYTNKVVHSFIP